MGVVVCPRCGKLSAPDATRCLACAGANDAALEAEKGKAAKKTADLRKGAGTLVAVLGGGALGLVVGLYLLYMGVGVDKPSYGPGAFFILPIMYLFLAVVYGGIGAAIGAVAGLLV